KKLSVAHQVAICLAYVHECDIIYKGITSSYVYVDEDGRVRLLPSLMSRTLEDITKQAPSGKLDLQIERWYAPEKLNMKGDSQKCDVYSFGVFLWELAENKIPYGGKA